jgi:hypothetical protein
LIGSVMARSFRGSRRLGLVAGLLLFAGPRLAEAAPSVWVVDDGEKIRRDATDTRFERGEDNPVWQPGEPVRVFAMRNESVSLQVVVEADAAKLDGVTVDVLDIKGGGVPFGDAVDESSRVLPWPPPVELFVEHFVDVLRASGGPTAGESLGWERGAGPGNGEWVGPVPDALVPVDVAGPSWIAYPMRIEPRTNGIVWIDLNVPRTQAPGRYRGSIMVSARDQTLAAIPLELEVLDATLPDRIGGAMVYYDRALFESKMGTRYEPLWRLLHAHRIAPMHDVGDIADLQTVEPALDGSAYRPDQGYRGPAPGLGDGAVAIGAYGQLGAPTPENLAAVKEIAGDLARAGLFGGKDVFVYADDENCDSPLGAAWRTALAHADDPSTRRVRAAWTCSDDPARQPVDIAMLHASYDPERARAARANGTQTWVYNGVEPHTGTFLLDAPAISPRVNGWLAEMFDVPRWMYWDATHWSRVRRDPGTDVFTTAETFENKDGDWANGDGVLVYPGRQLDCCDEHSLGATDVLPSIRLKNWRRGIEDAGYLRLARARDEAAADGVARWLVPRAFGEAPAGSAPSWPARGARFFEARRALAAIATGGARSPLLGPTAASVGDAATPGVSARTRRIGFDATATALALVAAVALWRGRRRRATSAA